MTAVCSGSIIVTGIGKAGWVGQKLAATLASTGSPAHFLHPSEAIHGDLGRVRPEDVVWTLSYSGRSDELVRIASFLRSNASGLIALTSTSDNPLAQYADCVVAVGRHNEACHNGLAPTCSTTVMLAVGDAIAMLASRLRQFTAQDFARYHPGGALGRKLARVEQLMRPLDACRVASQAVSVRTAMVCRSGQGRRTGAVMLVDEMGRLSGIFTDSDLARLIEARQDSTLDDPIASRMTKSPMTIRVGALIQDAIAVMSLRRISELPVLDAQDRPIGLIDVTDLVALGDARPVSQGV
jgi:arabinose-5-phosphate isomerase